MTVHEGDHGIVFLRKIVRGGTDKSYGIHVAKLAGLPDSVVERAKKILEELEREKIQDGFGAKPAVKKSKKKSEQELSLFS